VQSKQRAKSGRASLTVNSRKIKVVNCDFDTVFKDKLRVLRT